jgi:hypothetical protein
VVQGDLPGPAPKRTNPELKKRCPALCWQPQEGTPRMKYIIAVMLLAVAIGLGGVAFATYYAATLGGYSDTPCSRRSC